MRFRYTMNEEMSTACATYAQWLEDSTRVSAKDLVIYLFSFSLSLSLYLSFCVCPTVGVASSFEFVVCHSVISVTRTVVDE